MAVIKTMEIIKEDADDSTSVEYEWQNNWHVLDMLMLLEMECLK